MITLLMLEMETLEDDVELGFDAAGGARSQGEGKSLTFFDGECGEETSIKAISDTFKMEEETQKT